MGELRVFEGGRRGKVRACHECRHLKGYGKCGVQGWDAQLERSHEGNYCGPDGDWWEQKEPGFWSRLGAWLLRRIGA